MPGANHPFRMQRLESAEHAFVVHGRFPPGFARYVAGGYDVAEEFVVLDGELCLSGAILRRGDLTHVPPGHLRTEMSTTSGCTVLAWFDGPAMFAPGDVLDQRAGGEVTTVKLDPASSALLDLPTARWQVLGAGTVAPGVGDALDVGLTAWWRLEAGDQLARAAFVRTER
jgi:hypothetical protein